MSKNNSIYLFKLALISSIGGFLFGYDTSVISGAISSIQKYFQLDSIETGWAVSNVVLGCIIGSILSIWYSEHFGRKMTLIGASVALLISAGWSALSTTFIEFTLARILGGIGVGLVAAVSPMYISEIASKHNRGRLSMMNDFAIVFGQIIIFLVNYQIAKGMTQEWLVNLGWRYMLGSELIPCLVFTILLFQIPESPRWLAQKGHTKLAEDVVNTIYTGNELKDVIQSFYSKNETRMKTASKGLLFIACLLAMFQQLSGVNVMMYYAPTVLEEITGSHEEALFQTIWIGVAQLIGVFAGGYLLDKFGRVPMMKIGALGSAAGLFLVSYMLYTQADAYMTLAGMIIFMLFYAVSFGLGMWVLIAELFPNASRSHGLSIAVTFNWIANFAVAQTFPMINEQPWLKETFHGAFPMWIYGVCCILGFVFVSRVLKETKGKSLEQIEKLYS